MSDPALPITRQQFPAFLMNVPLSLSAEEANNVWMQELSMLRQGIVEKINELLGWDAVRELRFRIGQLDREPLRASIPHKKKPEHPPEKLDLQTKREMEEALAGIEDEELKTALKSMMTRGVKREKK